MCDDERKNQFRYSSVASESLQRRGFGSEQTALRIPGRKLGKGELETDFLVRDKTKGGGNCLLLSKETEGVTCGQ